MEQKYKTREEWLTAAKTLLDNKVFIPNGYPLSDTVVFSCSFATTGNKLGAKSMTYGQCFPPELSDDKANTQIVITPLLDDPIRVLDIEAHELCHHQVGCKHGHDATFTKARKAIGLWGKDKATNEYVVNGKSTDTKAGPELTVTLQEIANELGLYPHSALDTTGRKKQTTRMIKCECPECGMVVRASRKALENGPPHCWNPEHGPMEIVA